MQTFKRVLLYIALFFIWLMSSYCIITTNFFEFNFPMSLLLLFLPIGVVAAAVFYLRKK